VQVLRADFRGTDVAVKRVLPVSNSLEKARNELFDKQLSISLSSQSLDKLQDQLAVSDSVVLSILGDDALTESQRDSQREAPRSSDSAGSRERKSPQGSREANRPSGVVKQLQGQAQGLNKKNKSEAVYRRAKDSASSAGGAATATFGGDLSKTTMSMRMAALVTNRDLDMVKRTREFVGEMQVRISPPATPAQARPCFSYFDPPWGIVM